MEAYLENLRTQAAALAKDRKEVYSAQNPQEEEVEAVQQQPFSRREQNIAEKKNFFSRKYQIMNRKENVRKFKQYLRLDELDRQKVDQMKMERMIQRVRKLREKGENASMMGKMQEERTKNQT